MRSREDGHNGPQDVALTPRHSGFRRDVGRAGLGTVGLEVYFSGRQRLEVNPYRSTSTPYVIVGLLVEKRVGVARVFVNTENLTDVRQTNSLIRRDRGVDGRWTVDAWAPVDGRAINGVVRRILISMRLSTPPIHGSVCPRFSERRSRCD
jgi:outer membrane receptor for ferrienterochelin and colicins